MLESSKEPGMELRQKHTWFNRKGNWKQARPHTSTWFSAEMARACVEERMTFLLKWCWESCVFIQSIKLDTHISWVKYKTWNHSEKTGSTERHWNGQYFSRQVPQSSRNKSKNGLCYTESFHSASNYQREEVTYRMKKRQAKAGAVVDGRKGWRMADLLVLSHIKMRGRSSYMLLHNRVTRSNNCQL